MGKLSYDIPEPELIEVDLGGETFNVRQSGGMAWHDFVKAAAEEEADDEQEQVRQEARQMTMLFELGQTNMEEAEYEGFEKFCRARNVGIGLLLQIVQDVVGASAGRPTRPPSPSKRGRSKTGRGSTGVRSSLESLSKSYPSVDD